MANIDELTQGRGIPEPIPGTDPIEEFGFEKSLTPLDPVDNEKYRDISEDLSERKAENAVERLERIDKEALNKRIGNT
jgi:hypothetical protein